MLDQAESERAKSMGENDMLLSDYLKIIIKKSKDII